MPAKLDERPTHGRRWRTPDLRADCNDDTGKLVPKHCWKRYAEILLGEMQVGWHRPDALTSTSTSRPRGSSISISSIWNVPSSG
jgi:hypothetical protein